MGLAKGKMDTYHQWMEVVVHMSFVGIPCVTVPAVPAPAATADGMEDDHSMIDFEFSERWVMM